MHIRFLWQYYLSKNFLILHSYSVIAVFIFLFSWRRTKTIVYLSSGVRTLDEYYRLSVVRSQDSGRILSSICRQSARSGSLVQRTVQCVRASHFLWRGDVSSSFHRFVHNLSINKNMIRARPGPIVWEGHVFVFSHYDREHIATYRCSKKQSRDCRCVLKHDDRLQQNSKWIIGNHNELCIEATSLVIPPSEYVYLIFFILDLLIFISSNTCFLFRSCSRSIRSILGRYVCCIALAPAIVEVDPPIDADWNVVERPIIHRSMSAPISSSRLNTRYSGDVSSRGVRGCLFHLKSSMTRRNRNFF